MTISNELLDELLKGCERPKDLLGDGGLMKELKVRLMERMLGAELSAHLGYEAGIEPPPEQTNRRNGTSDKRLKNAELMLSHTAFRLGEMLQASNVDDRPQFQQTLAQVSGAENATMMQVFRSK